MYVKIKYKYFILVFLIESHFFLNGSNKKSLYELEIEGLCNRGSGGSLRELEKALDPSEDQFARKLKENNGWSDDVFIALQDLLIKEDGNFDDQKAKKVSQFVNKNSVFMSNQPYCGYYQEAIEYLDKFPDLFSPSYRFISFYMHSIPFASFYSNSDKLLHVFKKYMLPYCAPQNPFSLASLWFNSKKHASDSKNKDYFSENLPAMQDALLLYILKISFLYYILPSTIVSGLGFMAYKYRQNQQFFKTLFEKVMKKRGT